MSSSPPLRRLPILLLAGAALLALGARPRPSSQCNSLSQWQAVQTRLAEGGACNEQALATGQAECSTGPAPACAGTLVADVLALGWGAERLAPIAHDPGVHAEAFACQRALAQGAADYAERRLRLRIQGLSPEASEPQLAPLLDPVLQRCSVTVASDAGGLVLPAVGAQCAAAVGPPSAALDPARLRGCLETLLGLWVDRVAPNPRPLRPNVVLILTDDQRFDSVGPEHGIGGADVMPAVKAEIGGEGVTFSRAFVTTPLCCPSRSSLLTGQYAHTHGVLDNEKAEALDDSSTLVTWLSAAGYRTGLYGKYLNGYRGWVLAGNPYVPPGWSEWHAFVDTDYFNYSLLENGVLVPYGSVPEHYSTDVLRDKAIAFVRDAVARGQPFYLHFTPIAPHAPATPAPRHAGLFAGVAPFRPPSWNEPDVTDKFGWANTKPLSVGALAALDALRAQMLETLRAVDEASAALLSALREEGVLDDTLVIFMSDNGYHWAEHRMIGKGTPFDESTHVPLLIRYPRLAPLPRAEPRFALNVDLAPTIAELAGALPTHVVEGRSLVRVLDGTARDWRTHVLSEGWDDNVWAGVRDERWKYHEKEWGPDELYDLTNDPYELQSLGKEPAFAARRLELATLLAGLRPELFACADGRDNDGNGRIDLDDPGCDAPGDRSELTPPCGLGFELVLLLPLLLRWRRAGRPFC